MDEVNSVGSGAPIGLLSVEDSMKGSVVGGSVGGSGVNLGLRVMMGLLFKVEELLLLMLLEMLDLPKGNLLLLLEAPFCKRLLSGLMPEVCLGMETLLLLLLTGEGVALSGLEVR